MNTQTTYTYKSLLTILCLFCYSSLSLFTQQISSALHCSIILLFFFFLYRSALLLLYRSAILLFLHRSALHHILLSFCSSSPLPVIYSVSNMHFISFCTSIKLHPQHLLLSPFLLFQSFSHRTISPIECHSFSFIHPALTIPLPISFGKNNDNCPSNSIVI
jgi:hypothetical protein